MLEKVTLLNILGEEDKALQILLNYKFHPWEGGEGKVSGQYLFSHIEIGKKAIFSCDYNLAIEILSACFDFPENLGEGKLHGTQENDINYWMGCAYEVKNEIQNAKKFWRKAAEGLSEPTDAMYYNDQQPDKILYQGLALLKLGEDDEAKSKFNSLIDYGKDHISDNVIMDYFAVSLPDLLIFEEDLNKRNLIHCNYLIALGHLGLGNIKEAVNFFDEVLSANLYHIGAIIHRKMALTYTESAFFKKLQV